MRATTVLVSLALAACSSSEAGDAGGGGAPDAAPADAVANPVNTATSADGPRPNDGAAGAPDTAGDATSSALTHGSQLTPALVGPGAIGITKWTDVPGGYVTGTSQQPLGVPPEWVSAGVVRAVGAGGETIDGYSFPEGTAVVEAANITSHVDVYGNQPSGDYGGGAVGVVFRGCRLRSGGYSNLLARDGHGMKVMVSYSDIGAKDATQAEATSDGFAGSGAVGKPFIMKRNYITCMANAAEIGSHVIVEENLGESFCSFTGDHADGWQFGGGLDDVTVVRNKLRLNDTEGQTGCFSFFNDFADATGFRGYRNVVFDNNYIAGGGYSVYLPSAAYPVESFRARGNRWSTEFHAECGTYGPVYPTNPMDPSTGGNEWSDNRWYDGPKADTLIGIPGY